MRYVIAIVRLFAVGLGLMSLSFSVLGLAGLNPTSDDEPFQFGVRRAVVLGISLVLVAPYRLVRRPAVRIAGMFGIAATLLFHGLVLVEGVIGYSSGRMSWHVLPFSVALMLIIIANAAAYLQITRGRASSSGGSTPEPLLGTSGM